MQKSPSFLSPAPAFNADYNQSVQFELQSHLSEAELKLIRRLRALPVGAHLISLMKDGDGIHSLTVLGAGKVEKLRKSAQ